MVKRQLSERRKKIYLILKKYSKRARIWKAVSRYALSSRKGIPEVNLSKISKLSSPGDQVIVPGKVLGDGQLAHSVQIAAFSFSAKALKGIEKAKGQALSIEQLILLNPKGSGVKIVV